MAPKSTLFVALFFLSGCAEFKQAGTALGHGTRDAAREIGHASRDAAKAIGAGTERIWDNVTKGDDEPSR